MSDEPKVPAHDLMLHAHGHDWPPGVPRDEPHEHPHQHREGWTHSHVHSHAGIAAPASIAGEPYLPGTGSMSAPLVYRDAADLAASTPEQDGGADGQRSAGDSIPQADRAKYGHMPERLYWEMLEGEDPDDRAIREAHGIGYEEPCSPDVMCRNGCGLNYTEISGYKVRECRAAATGRQL